MKEMTKKERKDVLSKFGHLGGIAKFKKYGKEHMSKIGKKGAKSRWGIKIKNNKHGQKS